MKQSACGKCGAPRTHESVAGGLCPACLLSAALSDSLTAAFSEDEGADALPSGTAFGPFVIGRPLGRGGMAAVYEALDTRLERAVALKVLPPEFLRDQTSARRFATEARLIARLEHPNIVPIYASGIEAGVPWMSMRLLAGNNLGVLLEQRRLAPLEAVQLLRQVAAALDYAHAHGVVHRDIKPSNILLDASGAACVADFGLAQMMDSGNRLTQTGIVTGTPHYMAPEQALGKRVDHLSDIYSLGIVAYEVITGARPFTAESPVALLLQHVHEQLPVPADPSSSRWMDAIYKAAAKSPEDRWPTAGSFVDALEASIGAAPAGPDMTMGRPSAGWLSRRETLWAAAVGAIAVAGVAGMWLALEEPRPKPPEPPSSSTVVSKQEAAPSAPAPPPPPSGRIADADRPRTTTRVRPPKAPADRAPQTGAASAPIAAQPPPEPAPAATEQTSAPAPSPVAVENPVVPAPSTRTPAVAASAPPAADVMIAPVLIRKVHPVYPPALESAEVEGDVTLEGVIGIDGRVSNITVLRPAHPLLIAAARKAWLQWEYRPGSRNGVPEPTPHRTTFTFKLQ